MQTKAARPGLCVRDSLGTRRCLRSYAVLEAACTCHPGLSCPPCLCRIALPHPCKKQYQAAALLKAAAAAAAAAVADARCQGPVPLSECEPSCEGPWSPAKTFAAEACPPLKLRQGCWISGYQGQPQGPGGVKGWAEVPGKGMPAAPEGHAAQMPGQLLCMPLIHCDGC